jgi:hypothetical protein
LIDERFGFAKFPSKSDLRFLKGEKARRNLVKSTLHDFLFSEDDLRDYLRGARADREDVSDPAETRIIFSWDGEESAKPKPRARPPQIKRVAGEENQSPRQRKIIRYREDDSIDSDPLESSDSDSDDFHL